MYNSPLDDGLPHLSKGNLRSQVLTLWQVVGQSVAAVAPTATPALIAGLIFASAGNGTWLAFVFATVMMLLVASNINQFARRSSSAGSFYTFASQGLGATMGVICGWSLFIGYFLCAATGPEEFALFAKVLVKPLVNLDDTSLTLFLMFFCATLAGVIAYKDIQLSARVMLISEFISVAFILILVVLYFIGPGQLIDQPQISLENVTGNQLRLGLILAVFSFVGFESATTLGQEAKAAHQSVPKAVFLTVLISGAFFILTSYALIAAFRGHTPSLDKVEAPLNDLAALAHVPVFAYLISFGAAISFFSATLASLNAGARVLYVMSRHGLFHSAAGNAHQSNATPHVAIVGGTLLIWLLPSFLIVRGISILDLVTYLGTTSTFGFIFSYLLVSIAAPIYLWRRHELRSKPLLISIVSILMLMLPIIGSVYPVPDYPMNLLPYIFLGLLGLGVVRFLYLRITRPALIAKLERALEESSTAH